MFTFTKAQAVSLTASCTDFLVTIIVVEFLHGWYVSGTIAGTISGGITYFLLGRVWVFAATEKKILPQMTRYLLVWAGYLLLNASCVFLITRFGGANYIVSKVCVSILLGISYNYGLQKNLFLNIGEYVYGRMD
jgi:putative flippase GtrA